MQGNWDTRFSTPGTGSVHWAVLLFDFTFGVWTRLGEGELHWDAGRARENIHRTLN
jgi:hypothetical protein